jgi:hypothetical protein
LPSVPNGSENELAVYMSNGVSGPLLEAARNSGPASPEWIFVHTFLPRLLACAQASAIAESALNEIGAASQPVCVFTLNDTRFLPRVVARWA